MVPPSDGDDNERLDHHNADVPSDIEDKIDMFSPVVRHARRLRRPAAARPRLAIVNVNRAGMVLTWSAGKCEHIYRGVRLDRRRIRKRLTHVQIERVPHGAVRSLQAENRRHLAILDRDLKRSAVEDKVSPVCLRQSTSMRTRRCWWRRS